jgi:cytochrome c
VDTTSDPRQFREEVLQDYAAIIFLNTTGDILNDQQQAEMERYIQAGGGFMGIHSAADTEYDWKWYGQLVGAYFDSHPEIQKAEALVLHSDHAATNHLPTPWTLTDEWYNYKEINPSINPLLNLYEASYKGGNMGENHPLSWYHTFDGGRAFYTGLGHRDETFADKNFQEHLLAGLQYVMTSDALTYDKATTHRVPLENRFRKEVLDFNLFEPMELAEIPGTGILFIERPGNIKLFDFEKMETTLSGKLDVFYENEDGLLGLAVDPEFDTNNWIYLFYSPAGPEPIQRVSRFTLESDSLILASEKVLLTISVMRECCHSGGSLEFDKKGLLYIGIGDNTNPFESAGYAPIDERTDRQLWDAQKSAGNTNDLRGKILRIKPEDDGTYSIPKGNLFELSTDNTRPEIYVMGSRNPFRYSIDSQTGNLYWGDVGPDAGEPDSTRGPEGLGEYNQAKQAGNWGWPYTRGNNQAYFNFDFETNEVGDKFDPQNLINQSPNNTGLIALPPAQPSMIWYGYAGTRNFPWLDDGGVNPMSGPVYHASDYTNTLTQFPDYFENKWVIYEWMRDWIYVVTLDDAQQLVKADAFMPYEEFSHPMDMMFGSDGALYILEYGQTWIAQNLDARLSRVTYQSGNLSPIARIRSNTKTGEVPLQIAFSGDASIDDDFDSLTYEWAINRKPVSSEVSPLLSFDQPGLYTVSLTVTDPTGASGRASQKIIAGNAAPDLTIEVSSSDLQWSDKGKVQYRVILQDKEDGTTDEGTFDASQVKITFTYLPEGEDVIMANLGHQQNVLSKGEQVIAASDCKACHAVASKVNGPSYRDIASRYQKEDKATLINSVLKGVSGKWGETMMSAHPQLTMEEVSAAVDYILGLKTTETKPSYLPLEGTLTFNQHKTLVGRYMLIASYRDKGHPAVQGSSLNVSKMITFESKKED